MTQFKIDHRLIFLDRIFKNIFALSYSVAKIIFKSSLSKGFYYLVMTDELRRAKCMKIIAIFTKKAGGRGQRAEGRKYYLKLQL